MLTEKLINKGKITFFTVIMTLFSLSSTFAYDITEFFPLHQGNKWTYNALEDRASKEETVTIEGKETVGGIETSRIILPDDKYNYVVIDPEGVKMLKRIEGDEYTIFNPPMILFPNLELGQSKNYSIKSFSYNTGTAETGEAEDVTYYIALDSIVDVEVPAGKFTDCLKFTSVFSCKEGAYSCEEDCTTWLASGVGKVKEFCIDTEYNGETKRENSSTEIYELISAVVDGREIGSK